MYNYYGPSAASIRRRNSAIEWARNVLENKDRYLVVDTETTGLKEKDVVIHFAVMNLHREMLINTLVRPTRKRSMHPEAEAIHGITFKELKTAPFFEKVLQSFVPIWEGKQLLAYRAVFHANMIDQTIEQDGIAKPRIWLSDFECIQEKYQDFWGRDYLTMPGRDNTGEGDCNAALDVIEEMANAELQALPAEQATPLPAVGVPPPEPRHLPSWRLTTGLLSLSIGLVFILGDYWFGGFLMLVAALLLLDIIPTKKPPLQNRNGG